METTPDALDTTDQPLLELLLDTRHLPVGALFGPLEDDLGVLWPGEEIDNIDDSIFVDVACLQDVGRREILLLGGAAEMVSRVDVEVTPLVLVQETAEDGGRVELGPADTLGSRSGWPESYQAQLTNT